MTDAKKKKKETIKGIETLNKIDQSIFETFMTVHLKLMQKRKKIPLKELKH